ncbi:flagellar basal body rod protein FlgC, partial [Wolbachia endosymbiont of Drosophila barbarae]
MDILSYSTEKLKKHCQLLDDEEKIVLYEQLLDKAKDILENSRDDIAKLKEVSKAVVAIEETTDKQLLEKFNDDHPLREVDILIYSPQGNTEVANYLFSIDN